MTKLLSYLFFVAGIIGVLMGYSGGRVGLFTPVWVCLLNPINPYPYMAGIIFIATGGIIFALAEIKYSIDHPKKDRQNR